MVTKELVDFIKKARSVGKTNEQIKAALLPNGWADADIEEGLKQTMIAENSQINPALGPRPERINTQINPQPNSQVNSQPTGQMGLGQMNPSINPQPGAMPIIRSQPTPIINPRPVTSQMNPQTTTTLNPRPAAAAVRTQPVKKSKGPMVMAIIILILVAGGVSGYFFRDKIKTLLLGPEQVAVITPEVPSTTTTPPVTLPPTPPVTETPPVTPTPEPTPTTPAPTVPPATTTPPPTTPVVQPYVPPPVSCTLATKYVPEINLHPEVSITGGVKVLNFKGTAAKVSWSVQDKTIAEVSPVTGDGSAVSIKGVKTGFTKITVTDTAVGKDCTVSVMVNVLQ